MNASLIYLEKKNKTLENFNKHTSKMNNPKIKTRSIEF